MKHLLTLVCAAALIMGAMTPAVAQETGLNGVGIFANMGFGWANNLRMADWLNAYRDAAEVVLATNSSEEDDTANIIYGGFDLEPRYFNGNLVYGVSLGYHVTTKGERDVSNNVNSFHAETELSIFSMRASMYYRIGLDNDNFLLLGGGLGYYRASLKVAYGYNNNLESYDGSGWTIGWHTGLEYNMTYGPVVVSLGVLSRFAEIWNLEINKSNGDEVYDSGASVSGIYFYVGAGYMI